MVLDVTPVVVGWPGAVGGVSVGEEPSHGPPSSLQPVGSPLPDATKPKETLAPGSMVPLYSRFFAV